MAEPAGWIAMEQHTLSAIAHDVKTRCHIGRQRNRARVIASGRGVLLDELLCRSSNSPPISHAGLSRVHQAAGSSSGAKAPSIQRMSATAVSSKGRVQ